VAFSR